MNARGMLGAVICLAMVGPDLPAQTSPERLWRSWSHVATLQPGQNITVETIQPKRKLKGRFLSSNDSGIIIQTTGGEQTIPRTSVYKVTRTRSTKIPLAIGAASGVATYAMVAPRGDFNALGHFVFGAAFVGIGTLVGWAVGSAFRSTLIYQADGR